jgi:hypothetical protein|tara:strand:+ start:2062 stop:2256 length:195 start_codon:yes stop_codon:yes gene_type:complete
MNKDRKYLNEIIRLGNEADRMLDIWNLREKVDPLGWYTCPRRKYLAKAKTLDAQRLAMLEVYNV